MLSYLVKKGLEKINPLQSFLIFSSQSDLLTAVLLIEDREYSMCRVPN